MGERVSPAERVADLRARHGLSTADVARLCRVRAQTVRRWLSPPTASTHRECPEWAATLLALQVGEQEPEEGVERAIERQDNAFRALAAKEAEAEKQELLEDMRGYTAAGG